MNKENIVLYILVGAVIILLAVTVYSFIQPNYYGSDYQKAMKSDLADKCKTPPGYTDEQWKEHMGHHPDQYAECLG